MNECRTCDLLRRRDAGGAPAWDAIVRTRHWDVVHCDNTSVLGWTVLVLRRHVSAIADLTDDEASALGTLTRDVSRTLREVLHSEKTYVVQFAEHPRHRHVHVHVIPRAADLPQALQGPSVFQLLGVDDADRVPEADMNDFAAAVRVALEAE